MLLITKDNLDVLRMDSIQEQCGDLQDITEQLFAKKGFVASAIRTPKQEASWIGRHFKDIEEAVNAPNVKWDEGMMIFDMMMAQLRKEKIPPPESVIRARHWSEEDGDEIDIDRLRAGKPYWQSSTRSKRPSAPVITIAANVGTQCGRKSDDVFWRGAAAICLTELLEQAGYRVELWACCYCLHYNQSYNRNLLTAVKLKGPADPINTVPLVNAISGWYFRTATIASHHLVDVEQEIHYGYGAPRPLTKELMEYVTPDPQVIFCDEVWSESAAVKLVRERLQDIDNANELNQ